MTRTTVRPLGPGDQSEWFRLWRGYLEFYGTALDESISEATWSRLLSATSPVHGLVVESGVGVTGFLNYVLHENTWTDRPVCYLEDLFVDPAERGQGAGRSLIEYLADLARHQRWHRVYWMTKANNEAARRLYDRITPVTDWIRYDIDTRQPGQRS